MRNFLMKLAAVRGESKADLLIKNAQVINVLSGEIHKENVAVIDGRFIGFGDYEAKEVFDADGLFMSPGFIDGHIHFESTMLTLPEFSRAILQLFLQCGLRVGELVRLSRDDVTLHKTTGSLKVRDEKGKSEREIPLNKSARKALQDHLNERGPIAGLDPVFISERQRRISVPAVQHMIKRVFCLAGREDLSTHHLRHHFAFEFYSRSKKLTATQQVLGHSDINTTARYARATAMEIEETIDAMDS